MTTMRRKIAMFYERIIESKADWFTDLQITIQADTRLLELKNVQVTIEYEIVERR